MKNKTIMLLTVASIALLGLGINSVYATSIDYKQSEKERQGDYYKMSIKAFDTPGHTFDDHADYTQGSLVTIFTMNKTITGETDKFGLFTGGFFIPIGQPVGKYGVKIFIDGKQQTSTHMFVLKWVPEMGPGGDPPAAPILFHCLALGCTGHGKKIDNPKGPEDHDSWEPHENESKDRGHGKK